MPRLTSKLFTDLAIWMTLLGVVIGLLFPPFTVILGFDEGRAYSLTFWIVCVVAGLLVAYCNYMLANAIVRSRIRQLSQHMRKVEKAIDKAVNEGDWSSCDPLSCSFLIDSDDELGASASSFNDLVQALFRSHEVESAVSDFTKALSSQLDLDLLSSKALELLLHHTGAVAGMVITQQAGEQRISANYGIRNPENIAKSDHLRKAMLAHDVVSVSIPEDVYVEAVLTDFRPREIIAIPVEFKNEILGAVILATSERFSSDSRWMIQFFRQGFGLALNNAVIHCQMQEMAALDALTGALDRRFGISRFKDELARADRAKSSLAVLMLDLDHFKKINDVFGHLVGDKALVVTVKVIHRVLRESDVVIRYGGEEFLMLLPLTDLKAAALTAERIREAIQGLQLTDANRHIPVTASIGLTSYPEDDSESLEGLIKHADQALYHAKDAGRNRVNVYNRHCIH
ncbi:MAG: sensor domain-containing diguanylate cyclase [Gammaproteobacteria bacterium]|nr:sensor domain-containing diguanylate cyclase [Gammaproteobacteria bacterium]